MDFGGACRLLGVITVAGATQPIHHLEAGLAFLIAAVAIGYAIKLKIRRGKFELVINRPHR